MHVRNEMAKRKVTFQKDKPMVTVCLVRRPADTPDVLLTPQYALAWTPVPISSSVLPVVSWRHAFRNSAPARHTPAYVQNVPAAPNAALSSGNV